MFGTYATGLQRYMLIMPTAVFEGFTLAVPRSEPEPEAEPY